MNSSEHFPLVSDVLYEDRLLRLFCGGMDPLKLDAILASVRVQLWPMAIRLTSCKEDAEDIVQETLIDLYDQVGALTAEEVSGLAFNILGRRYIDLVRSKGREVEETVISELDAETVGQRDFDLSLALYEAGIDLLPHDRQEVVTLRVMGLTVREVSEVTGRSISTISEWCADAATRFGLKGIGA